MNGRQVQLFLVDGTPSGLTTAEITNWTGHVLSARRSDLGDLLRRDEAQRTGVYLLLGDTTCDVGEADIRATRLRAHASNKERGFRDRVVVITSKDTSHGRYLESRLIELAAKAGRVSLSACGRAGASSMRSRNSTSLWLDAVRWALPHPPSLSTMRNRGIFSWLTKDLTVREELPAIRSRP